MATWKFGSTDLTSAGVYNVIDLSDAQGIPPVRGDNAEIPMREGRPHLEKMFDQRLLTLGMYLKGSSISNFESNLDTLKLLFGKRARQYLTRTMNGGATRRVYAEVTKFDVKQEGNDFARMTVDFLLAEPFFRSTTETNVLTAITTSPQTFTITNAGSTADRSAIITFNGTLNYPKLTNVTNGVWVGYNDVVAVGSGNAIVVDSSAFTCLMSTTNMLNKLVHSGDSYFFKLEPGANTISLETLTTGGSVRIQFYPPYL